MDRQRVDACFHAVTVGVPLNVRQERKAKRGGGHFCHGNVCMWPDGGVRGEILGRDIGPQATNSYG